MKNGLLKQEINELRAKQDDLGIENEEVKTKNESLKTFIQCLEEKLESEYKSVLNTGSFFLIVLKSRTERTLQ